MTFTTAKDLTHEEKNALTELRAGVMWAQPFFSHLLLDQCNLVPSRDIPYAATDGKNIYLNPAKFAEWDLQQRLYVLCHEICHVMWEHCEQAYTMRDGIFGPNGMLPVDLELVNKVQDWTINAFLDECKIGKHPKEGHFNPRIKGGESWVGIYAEEYAKAQQNSGKGHNQQPGNGLPPLSGQGSDPPPNPGGFDNHLPPGAGEPGKTPAQAVQERKDNQSAMAQAINQALQVAKARGKVPDAIQRLVDALLEPKVDWKDKLATLVTKTIGGGNYDWKSPDPIMLIFADPVYTPRRAGIGVGTVVVAVDTSGSVGQREMNIMGGAMAGIFEQAMPETAHVVFCDAKVHGVHELDDPTDIDAVQVVREAVGGGGTMFSPVFDKLDELNIIPDCLVYLTDGYGSAPQHAPTYPVVWAITPGGSNSCPWGDTVELEV